MALNATTGAIIWDTLTKGPMIFDGAYSDGRFIRGGTDDNTLYCFNATNGQILWTFTPDTNGYFTTGPAIAYGMVYEMNKDGYLYAIDIATGNLVWKYKGPNDTLIWPGMPTVADGKIYVATSQRNIFILDTTNNGTRIASFTTPSSSWSSPTIANGRLYIGCNDWNVYCLAEYPAVTVAPASSSPTHPPAEYIYAVVIALAAIAVVLLGYAYVKRRKK